MIQTWCHGMWTWGITLESNLFLPAWAGINFASLPLKQDYVDWLVATQDSERSCSSSNIQWNKLVTITTWYNSQLQQNTHYGIILVLFSQLCLGLTSGFFPRSLPTKILYTLLSSLYGVCPAHLMLDLLTLTVLTKKYKLCSSFCNFLHSFTSS